jgi:CBS domain containing-hemolysin-like protein
LEELVGEIWDEHDEKVIEIQKVGEKQYVVSGKASVSKLFDELDIDDEIEAQTVNGWSMNELEKIPEVGDVFETEKLRCEVIETDGKIIGSLSVTDLRESDDDEDGDKSKPVQTEIKF